MKKSLTFLAALAAATTALAHTTPEQNKAAVLAFYELAFNQHKVQEAVDKYVGAEYRQHNPTVADGGKDFVDAFEPFLKANPKSKATIKRVLADGDLVALHVHSQLDDQDKGEAVVDIFRFDENGKIIEHWDVIQAVPTESASGRGMF
ncbi:membrane protein [[Actinobacillus] muris]|uniref:Membrane protein n=1 Tax=Muribacter muris TaxID=67855 RepID=A0A0J5P5M2_9PAST|nr:nuclear transport factor 2 family protein [Muribacter muris]KMK51065.1 membrane protein [[Actinobacillus] muris] [Muribacter muris]